MIDCKPVMLVTLGGCHLLDGLVVVSIEARKEDCAVLWRTLQDFRSTATPKNCNVENLVARDCCITTILKNGSDTCL